jgi:predicted dehydrogenase
MNGEKMRVGFYGCGQFAQSTRIPGVLAAGGDVVALSDVNAEAMHGAAALCPEAQTYADAHEMLEKESLDVLYSIVPAFARTDVEITAAERGIHLFSEKPQVLDMALGWRIERAVANGGVVSTVGVRERYRPLFQEAKKWLADKRVVHMRFQSFGGLPGSVHGSWWDEIDKSGGRALDWGVHATDYLRFMTGLEVVQAQAFYHQPEPYVLPLSSSLHYAFDGGATAVLSFLSHGGNPGSQGMPGGEPWFVIYCEEGVLALHGYERLVADGVVVYEADDYDPWREQDRVFVEAVRAGDASLLMSDYRDALYSLGPVLAAWESSRLGGQCVDVAQFMKA